MAQKTAVKYKRKKIQKRNSSIFRKCYSMLEYKLLKLPDYSTNLPAVHIWPTIKAVQEAQVTMYTKAPQSCSNWKYHAWALAKPVCSDERRGEKKPLWPVLRSNTKDSWQSQDCKMRHVCKEQRMLLMSSKGTFVFLTSKKKLHCCTLLTAATLL